MKTSAFVALLIILSVNVSQAEDHDLVEANLLLLKASDMEIFKPSERPKFKVEAHFTFNPTSKHETKGVFVRRLDSTELWQDELEFGGFHYSKVRNGNQIWTLENFDFIPMPAEKLLGAVFALNFRMTATDVVKRVHDRKVNGVQSRCIDYENDFAKTSHDGQICVQKDTGTVNYTRYETLETYYSSYAPFAGKVRPRHIEMAFDGTDAIVAEVSYSQVSAFDFEIFKPVPGAVASNFCSNSRPPIAKYAPDPVLPPDFPHRIKGKVIVDVKVGPDGHVLNAAVAQSLEQNLDELALRNAKVWQFEPGTCDGNPVMSVTKLTLTYH